MVRLIATPLAVNPRFWAWFDVHRAKFWQMVAASLVVGAFTFTIITVLLALFQM